MRNGLRTFTGVSAANTAKTHTVTLPKVHATSGAYREIRIHSLTVSTGGGDLSADCTISVQDNASEVWKTELRSGKVFGGNFNFGDYPIVIRNGDLTIVTDAGGANVIVTISAVYSVM